MKKYIFENKENYLQMKQNWATYFNTEARKLERNEYGNKECKLTATHFALYAILRGKDPFKGLNSCCSNTLEKISFGVRIAKNGEYYTGKWKKFFNLTKEEHNNLISIAYDIFENRESFEKVKQERIPISEEQLMECLA